MPRRKVPLLDEKIYHVLNRGVNRIPLFTNQREYKRALRAIDYYRISNNPVSLAKYLIVNSEIKEVFNLTRSKAPHLVNILAYCLMPNHYHLLLKQNKDGGISKFVGDFQNSYTRYFNTRRERQGNIFVPRFKAVLIETDEQLKHVSRYIHLNPFSSGLVKTKEELINYTYSSLKDYALEKKGGDTEMIFKKPVLELFQSNKTYLRFVWDNADYQKKLERIKHLTLE